MNLDEDDDALLEIGDEPPVEAVDIDGSISRKIDARRLIERRLELRKLRQQLDDPSLYYDFD